MHILLYHPLQACKRIVVITAEMGEVNNAVRVGMMHVLMATVKVLRARVDPRRSNLTEHVLL